ncbi:hypothetical protein Taro_020825 [Colocasia esculenta]|uniref:Uncharacterized protein n=1 Tax=Colocasia esculenta TaxID=4460 RepID=A0A843UXD4_COLES|nr:hypothetical protein [Colocasia esculenta]
MSGVPASWSLRGVWRRWPIRREEPYCGRDCLNSSRSKWIGSPSGVCYRDTSPIATGLLLRCPSPLQWYHDGLGGRDSACVCLGCSVVPVGVSACAPGLACPQDLQVENTVGYLAAFSD